MKLTDLITIRSVIPNLAARHKKALLEELCTVLANEENIDRESLLQVLLEREKLGSTGIGDGIAIPHGKTNIIDKILIAFGRSSEGVEFDSMDGKPTYLFFLILVPEESGGLHLKVLAKISRLLKDSSFREELIAAEDEQAIYKIIEARDGEF